MSINAIDAARQDTIAGLTGPFEVDPKSFEVRSEFSDPIMENGAFSTVPWSVTATHVGSTPVDGDTDPQTFVGLAETQRTVVIEGVTIVKHPLEGTRDEPEFRRYIDWSAVLAQLGVTMTGRPLLATE